jgi:hypothetical protein
VHASSTMSETSNDRLISQLQTPTTTTTTTTTKPLRLPTTPTTPKNTGLGPEAYYRSLPDTPANRKLLFRWSEQDARRRRAQQQLFSHVQEPVEPPPNDLKTYQYETAIITLQPEDDADAPVLSKAALDQLVVSRMLSGSASTQISTSEEIFMDTISAVNIETEFPTVFAYKKNFKASVFSLVSYLREKERFAWPTSETGSALRENLRTLASVLMTEFPIPPKLIAVIELVALFQAPKLKLNLLSDFHAAQSHSDADFHEFQELYSQGRSDDSVLNFKPAALQPGFDRLMSVDSVDAWIDTAAVLIDSACFQDIVKMEQECNTALEKWKRFSISDQDPKSARVAELQLFMALTVSTKRAGIPLMDHVSRAQALLRSITLTIRLQGKPVSVRELIRDRIAENRFGKAAVSRDLVFELYEHFYDSSGLRGCESHAIPPEKTAIPPDKAAGRPARVWDKPSVLTVDLASDSMTPVLIVCRDCGETFQEIPGEWAAIKPGMCMPKGCKPCRRIAKDKKRGGDTLMITEACVGNFDTDSDSDSSEDPYISPGRYI